MSRSKVQKARAHRALEKTEANLIARISRNEKLDAKIKKVTAESNRDKKPDAPTRENPFARIMRKLDEERQKQNPSGAS